MKKVDIETLTPKEIVKYLDKYIIGQDEAKKAVAIALRNRWRRQQLPKEIQEEIYPKNILLIGPTGVGKTEIARRIAKLTRSPFVKVEASKFTEVGYVGRDVESMIRDLVEVAVNMVKNEYKEMVKEKAKYEAEEKILDLLIPSYPKPPPIGSDFSESKIKEYEEIRRRRQALREKFRQKLRKGDFDDEEVEIEVKENYGGMIEIFSSSGIEEIAMQMKDMLPGFFQKKTKKRKMKVKEALEVLTQEEADKLIDMDKVIREALERAEQNGIIFIDEIDKIAGRESGIGPDVSREGVQRDLLPIIEGSTVTTKYGMIKTDHILFFGAGAFNVAKPSDLIPELQGRFPIKVDLHSLTKEDLARILIEPENSLIKQYQLLLQTEGVQIEFTQDAIDAIAELALKVNELSENIGARRLHTIIEKMLFDISFNAPELKGKKIVIDSKFVHDNIDIKEILTAEDIRKRRKIGFVKEEIPK